jgi:hypothetical protein
MQNSDDFWTEHSRLFDGTFRYFDRSLQQKIPVWGKLHVSEERYDATHELVQLSVPGGTRVYVMLHPYVLQPKLIMTVGLYKKPKQLADTDPVIGKTLGTRQEGLQEIEIGSGQAWYYPEDRTLVLWECFLNSFVRDSALLQDTNMTALWYSFEAWLRQRFPDTRTIATPFSDPLFQTQEYQAFLRTLGFSPIEKAVFGKAL